VILHQANFTKNIFRTSIIVLRTTRVEARFSVNRLDSNKTRRGEARINYNFSLTRLGSIRFDVETSQGEVEARSRRYDATRCK